MPATPLPLTATPLATQIEKFDVNCGGLSIQQALNLIGQIIGTVLGDGVINVATGGAGVVQSFGITSHVLDTTVAAGATLVEFHLSSDFTGTIDGVSYSGADWVTIGPFVASPGNTLDAIAVVRTTGTIKIVRIA
jgi:hypothetical protein